MVSQINMPDAERHAALLAEADKELAKLANDASRYVEARGRAASPSASPPIQREPCAAENSDVDPPPLSRGGSRPIRRFTLAFLLGVAATLGWQSYGYRATERLAVYAPQLASLHSANMSSTQPEQPSTTPDSGNPPSTAELEHSHAATNNTLPQAAAPDDPPPYPEILQRLEGIAGDIGEMRAIGQEVAELKAIIQRLAAGQRTITNDLSKVQEVQEQIQRQAAASPARLGSQVRRSEPIQATSPEASRSPSPGTLPPPPPRPPLPLR
jgi:hypothetical protein